MLNMLGIIKQVEFNNCYLYSMMLDVTSNGYGYVYYNVNIKAYRLNGSQLTTYFNNEKVNMQLLCNHI